MQIKPESCCMTSSIPQSEGEAMQNRRRFHLDCGKKILDLSERTHLMGILNVTPDSFSDGGRYFDTGPAVERGLEMERDGADIIDVGGESTRPGAGTVTVSEEIDRVIPVIEGLSKALSVPISIDTTKAAVAVAAIDAGADIVNDISAMRADPEMVEVVKRADVPVVLMHMRGTPKTMQQDTEYGVLIEEISAFLMEAARAAVERGIAKEKIVVDPGIGFGKTWADNFLLLSRLPAFVRMGYPLLVGPSRKSFIGWALDLPEDQRLMGTASAVAASVLKGAHMVRVHDVKEMVQVTRIADRIVRAASNGVKTGLRQ
jgi:dihydropteroate synthase